MTVYHPVKLLAAMLAAALSGLNAQNAAIPLSNWTAPLHWQPAAEPEGLKDHAGRAANLTGPLPFIGVTPCRVADTRGTSGQSGAFGPPILSANTLRRFPILSSPCGIPATAKAFSLNVTVVPAGPVGYLALWPAGLPRPVVSTLNSPSGAVVANAAIVPAGAGGAVDVFAEGSPTHVILDINGYYDDSPSGRGGFGTVVVTPAAGGTGPNDTTFTLACPDGAVATGLRVGVVVPNTSVVNAAAVVCTPAVFGAFGGGALAGPATLTASAGNFAVSVPGFGSTTTLSCPADSVMTGLQGTTYLSLIGSLSIQCVPISPGPAVVVGPAGFVATVNVPFALPCPGRTLMTGIQGLIDDAGMLQIQARCQ
ncbi:MAG: hypothetical protein SFV51_20670 [Bryobacteraceae bacterium]|nr:hypothetical protein [Bryobacteraceae bacterium]